MNLKFYKTGTKPTTIGSLWFNPTTKRIELITGTSTSDVYGSDIQDATYSNDILTIEKIDGSAITINLSDYATSSELENSLANKLNKIKVNNSTVNSTNLNIVGSGGTTVSNNSGTITISSETAPTSFDASAITSGTIALERLPKGALERLFIVSSENDAMRADCQEGDTVQVTGNNNKMYFCVNGSATTFTNKFREYTAGAATSVPWSGVTGRPNVEDGAQKNVQSDWNAISGDAFILNKPTIPTKTSQLTNDSGYLTEHQSLDNYYTKEQTDSSINAVMDAMPTLQTYDIGWLMNLFSTSTDGTVTLTAEQFNEIKAAADAHKIFVAYGQVFSSSTSYRGDDTYIELTQLFGDYVSTLIISSLNGTYKVSVTSDQIITRDDLSGYAKSSDVPTKTSQLTNDSGFAKTSDIPTKTSQLTNDSGFLTEHQSLDGYVRKREVVKTLPDNIGYGNSYTLAVKSIELAADKFHVVGRCKGLTLTLPEGADMDGQEYCCQFYVPNQDYTLTVPADVRWQNGEVPTFEGNTCCQLVIVNNCATIGVFKASS